MTGANYKLPYVQSSSTFEECSSVVFLRLLFNNTFLDIYVNKVSPCFFLSCKANARVQPAKTGHSPHSSKIFVLFYVLFVLCRCVYCLSVNVYCTTATGWLPNCN